MAAAADAGRAIDALTGSACAGLQAELIQRLAFRLLGRRCRRSPAFRAHLLCWICRCAVVVAEGSDCMLVTRGHRKGTAVCGAPGRCVRKGVRGKRL